MLRLCFDTVIKKPYLIEILTRRFLNQNHKNFREVSIDIGCDSTQLSNDSFKQTSIDSAEDTKLHMHIFSQLYKYLHLLI